MLLLPVVLLSRALAPLAVFRKPVLLLTSAETPSCRIAASGVVEEGESSGGGVVIGCSVRKKCGEPTGGVVYARGVVEQGVESECTVLGALIVLKRSVPKGRVSLGGGSADYCEQDGE
jgi:hypothetical protein